VSSNPVAVEIGRRIAELRHRTGQSKKAMAEAADMDTTHYARIENGTGNPTAQMLVQLAVAFEIDPGQLIEGLGIDSLADARRPYPYSQHHLYRRRQPRRTSGDGED
jgi:transcriptional regulator with XRE-family HTH domain